MKASSNIAKELPGVMDKYMDKSNGLIPKVSIIMSVYNGEKYIQEAVDSLLRQTFSDFEFLIVDDDSSDGTWTLLNSITDSRVVIFHNDQNMGLTCNLNYLIEKAKGSYIARMDADDLCDAKRLEKEVAVLDGDETIQMVCAYSQCFGDADALVKTPADYELLRAFLLFGNPITHSSVMFRKSEYHYYDTEYVKSQDFELWDRMVAKSEKIHVIKQPLVYYRIHDEQITKIGVSEQEVLTENVLIRAAERLGLKLNEENKRIYLDLIRKKQISSDSDLKVAFDLLNQMRRINRTSKIYHKQKLFIAMGEYYLCMLKYCLSNMSISSIKLFIMLVVFSSIYKVRIGKYI